MRSNSSDEREPPDPGGATPEIVKTYVEAGRGLQAAHDVELLLAGARIGAAPAAFRGPAA